MLAQILQLKMSTVIINFDNVGVFVKSMNKAVKRRCRQFYPTLFFILILFSLENINDYIFQKNSIMT